MLHARRRRLRERLPLVLSTTALVVAVLGSTPLGEAARDAAFPRNSVGTEQLKSNAVTSPKIRNGSVQGIDIQKSSITAAHVKPGSLLATSFRTGQLPAGSKGDKGDKGEKGDKGDKGDAGPRTPAWGDATGPGFSDNFSTWKDTAQPLKLAPLGARASRYFVFGRVSAELTCSSAGACAQTYGLFVNGNYVPQTSATVFGSAGQKTRGHISVFGVAAVARTVGRSDPVLSLRYRNGSNHAGSSIGISLGAIALG